MSKFILHRELSEDERGGLAPHGNLLAHLLFYRGVKNQEEAEIFLHPNFERDLHDPFLILNMERTVERILRAVSQNEKIVVYGDYDCDGIPGSVILHDFFKKIGYRNFYVYIPHRHLEGYGLNTLAIEKFAKDGVRLLVTVDNGITNVEEVDRANEFGIDVIITDHHLPQEEIPNAYAILNSKQEADNYPFDMLCGAGVAFKLVQALIKRLNDIDSPSTVLGATFREIPKGWEKWLLDMAGLSTIADMVPLRGENRALAYFGLKVLQRSSRPGLMKLLYKARVDQGSLSEEDVGFTIGPRINAASRMGEPIQGFYLLAETDSVKAGVHAEYLETKNNERKRAVEKMMQAIEVIMQDDDGLSVIVVGHRDWAPGVVGLAAGRIVDKYKRPAFVWGMGDSEEIKGSCRSDGEVNIVDLMVLAGGDELFLDMGGHALAGGFSVSEDNLDSLKSKLPEAYLKLRVERDNGDNGDKIEVDKKISIDDVTLENCNLVARLAPFGVGNRRPSFLLEDLEIYSVNFFGAGRNHLRLDFKNSFGETISAILFKYKDKTDGDFVEGDKVDLLVHMEKDSFGYKEKVRLRIVEIL